MNGKCYEIGALQAFLDGETSPEMSFMISGHVAECDKCAAGLAVAEEENSTVFSVLDREFNSMVPTQRLWSSINTAISSETAGISFWDKVRRGIATLIANPSLTAAAGVLVMFAIFAAVWNLRPATSAVVEGTVAENIGPRSAPASPVAVAAKSNPEPYKVDETHYPEEAVRKFAQTASLKRTAEHVRAQPAVVKTIVDPAASAETYLPGEQTYVRTIADLKQNVDGQKDRIMNPSSRIAYERDMAVVNDAIRKMREVVKTNPKNQSAKQVLYSSYQNKIDLLNSVVEREELMASLR